MRLHSTPKVYGSGIHRAVAPAETLKRAKKLMGIVGVTRLADITGLDTIGIPTYSAVVPKSRDVLSIYNGKGATKVDAQVGALMEAIERHAALTIEKPLVYGTYRELNRQRAAFDPRDARLPLHPTYGDDTEVAWAEGFDLLGQMPVLVPVELAGYNVIGKFARPCYALTTTNGLASGNSIEEAICHALCELIERDAWTIAELLSHWLPYARYRRHSGPPKGGAGGAIADSPEVWDDVERYPSIEWGDIGEPIAGLLAKFYKAGLHPLVKDVTSDLGIPTVLATVAEEISPTFPRAHFGLGTHPDARVAATRALTEVAQSRVVDIQGVREDISQSAESHPYLAHTKRVDSINRRSWYHRESPRKRTFATIRSYVHGDILSDIELMLDRLREGTLERAIVIDLTKPGFGLTVVRVLVPGLESWAADRTRTGRRAAEHWRACAG